jgi:hypothetical protein
MHPYAAGGRRRAEGDTMTDGIVLYTLNTDARTPT